MKVPQYVADFVDDFIEASNERTPNGPSADAGTRTSSAVDRCAASTGSVCVWTPDENGIHETGCGEMFEFMEGTPKANGARFCMYCGGEITSPNNPL